MNGLADTRAPMLLLLAGSMPGRHEVGAIILRDACLAYPRGRLCCFIVADPRASRPSADLEWLRVIVARRPYLRPRYFPNIRFGGLSAFFLLQYARLMRESALLRQCARFCQEHGIERVWAVLDHPSIYHLASALTTRLGLPLATTVWDPPERITADLGFDGFSRKIALKDFATALSASRRCGVMSETMRDEYKTKYGVDGVVLRHGVARSERVPPCKVPGSGARFVIGYAGSGYAGREWGALMSALANAGWRINGKDVMIRLLTRIANFGEKGPVCIEYLGWRSTSETIRILSESDVNYLPYWFDPEYSQSVRLCFPSKLATYLAAGSPVLFHGPEDSSPALFFQKYPVGLCCHSLEEPRIIESLTRLATDKELYASAVAAGQRALDEELNRDVFLRRFAELVGVEESDLKGKI